MQNNQLVPYHTQNIGVAENERPEGFSRKAPENRRRVSDTILENYVRRAMGNAQNTDITYSDVLNYLVEKYDIIRNIDSKEGTEYDEADIKELLSENNILDEEDLAGIPSKIEQIAVMHRNVSDQALKEDITDTLKDANNTNLTLSDVLKNIADNYNITLEVGGDENTIMNALFINGVLAREDFKFLTSKIQEIAIERKLSNSDLDKYITRPSTGDEVAYADGDNLLSVFRQNTIGKKDVDSIEKRTQQINELREEANSRSKKYAEVENETRLKEAEEQKRHLNVDKIESVKNEIYNDKKYRKHKQNLEWAEKQGIFGKGSLPEETVPKGTLKAQKDDYEKTRKIFIKKMNTEELNNTSANEAKSLEDQMSKDLDTKWVEYHSFLENTHHHPSSFKAADFVDKKNLNVGKVEGIINEIKRFPRLESLLEGVKGSTFESWQKIMKVLGSEATSSILELIDPQQLISFGKTDEALTLLSELWKKEGIDSEKVGALAGDIGYFSSYIGSDEQRAKFIVLFTAYETSILKDLLETAKAISGSKDSMTLIKDFIPRMQDVSALLECLKYASEIGLKQEHLDKTFNSQDSDLSADAIKNKINENALSSSVIDKDANNGENFKEWMMVLDKLIAHADFDIKISESRPLKSKNDSKTYARECYVIGKGGTKHTEQNKKGKDQSKKSYQFEIHYHPEATKAAIGSANSSQVHLKPNPGNKDTKRIYADGMTSMPEYKNLHEKIKNYLSIKKYKD